MIKTEHAKRAKEIGDDSWELLAFTQLRKNASKERQVEALARDRDWLRRKYEEAASAIDDLIWDIGES